MIYGVRDGDEYLYHYTSAETARGFILKNGTLKLGTYTTTNDPKEARDWQFSLWTAGSRDLGSYAFAETSKRFSDLLKRKAKLACFSTDTNPLTGDPIKDILNRGFAKPRMWAQYGVNHTGVCLVFRKSALLSAVRSGLKTTMLFAGPVAYRNRLILGKLGPGDFTIDIDLYESLGPTAYARSHLQVHHHTLFFEKLQDWRDEAEWRIVAFTDADESEYAPFGDSLVGVMHGASIAEDISWAIAEMTDDAHVKHMGLTWKNSSPWYHFEAMRWSSTDRKSPWARRP